ncbi:MAG: hypothetical protein WCX65_05375, partial [bacterium]
MKNKSRIILPILALVICAGVIVAKANWLMPVTRACDFNSHTDPIHSKLYEPGIVNFNRDFTMGASFAPSIDDFWFERDYPYPGENVTIRIKGSSSQDATGSDGIGAQKLLWAEIAYTLNGGRSWYMNNPPGYSYAGSGVTMDFFTHEVLAVENRGSIKYRQYAAKHSPWAVTPLSAAAFNPTQDRPAPNRRCDPADMYYATRCPAYLQSLYPWPYNRPCPFGLLCPLYDTYPPNTGEGGYAGWPAATCSKGAGGACNVTGFPEGGGDILDSFPSIDPELAIEYPMVPGEALVRVNGVPGIDCDIYNGVAVASGTYVKPMHPLCDSAIDPKKKAVYDMFGIKAYKKTPKEGKVRFTDTLKPGDVVDATFYSHDMQIWTAKLDMNNPPLDTMNFVGSRIRIHPRIYDTCGNLGTGSNSPPFPVAGADTSQALLGVKDFYYDQIPTDQDAMVQVVSDDPSTQCGATDQWCPATFPKTRQQIYDAGGCADKGCECCYNECIGESNTYCDYIAFRGDNPGAYDTMCHGVGDVGNPPGCGPESQGNTGMAEIREFKIGHSAANIYLKLQTSGEIVWGCYGSWYPILGCEYSTGALGHKFNAYGWQIMNLYSSTTYYLLIIPDIPIYNSLSLFLDINKLISGIGDASGAYDGKNLEQYADGGGCKRPGQAEPPGPDPCETLGCGLDPKTTDPNLDCDGDGFVNASDGCECEDGGENSEDGCKPPDTGGGMSLDAYKCNSCVVSVSGNTMFVEMGKENTIGNTGGKPVHALALHISLHQLDVDWILYYACLNGMNLIALTQDTSPRINYYDSGKISNSEVEFREDYTSPEDPSGFNACLGRCDEADRTNTLDDDGDSSDLEPIVTNRTDEGYDPTSAQIEIQWREVISNKDYLKSDLIDLGGYQLYMSREGGNYGLYYTMCSPT